MGLSQSVEGLNQTKRVTLSERERILLPGAFQTGTSALPGSIVASGFWTQTGTWALQILDFSDSIIV